MSRAVATLGGVGRGGRGRAFRFKVATTEPEFEQIHRLNYRTFVEEIPQHPPNPDGRLVDRFHDENTYLVCLRGDRVVGMMAVRARRPYSLDDKLPDLDAYLPEGRRVCEIRLLAVEPASRRGRVFWGLATAMARFCKERGYDFAVASCSVTQRKLYEHLGFVAFGPLVGTPGALFQPMSLAIETFEARARALGATPTGGDDSTGSDGAHKVVA